MKDLLTILKDKLTCGIANFAFVKKDGSVRVMYATLMPVIVEAKTKGNGKTQRGGIISFWDVENGGWRSCRTDTIIWVG